MTNKDFFYKNKTHVSQNKCECKDVIDRMNEEIENLKTIIKGYKDELKTTREGTTV
jgi:hypothetical protein